MNAFNQLSFNKFVENVVEETDEAGMAFGAAGEGATDEGTADASGNLLGDMMTEDDKLTEALQIALNEIAKAKEDKKEA